MHKVATLLLFCDSRVPWREDASFDFSDSILALPQKRRWLCDYAAHQSIEVAGQVTIEIEHDADLEKVINRAVDSLCDYDADTVLSIDAKALKDLGLFAPLTDRLEFWKRRFIDVAPAI
jgi:hypothetical protein